MIRTEGARSRAPLPSSVLGVDEEAEQREHERDGDQPGDEQVPPHYAASTATSPAGS
jgi:hypothetical protein